MYIVYTYIYIYIRDGQDTGYPYAAHPFYIHTYGCLRCIFTNLYLFLYFLWELVVDCFRNVVVASIYLGKIYMYGRI